MALKTQRVETRCYSKKTRLRGFQLMHIILDLKNLEEKKLKKEKPPRGSLKNLI